MKSFLLIILGLCVVVVSISAVRSARAPHTGEFIQSKQTSIMEDIKVTSSAFENGEMIPKVYTCDGDNTNPPLEFSNVPENAASLVLIMDDPDVPEKVRSDKRYVHWVAFNIAPDVTSISVGDESGVNGVNTSGKSGYTGPCPPTQFEPTTHRYFFHVYALDTMIDLQEGADEAEVMQAIDGHILGEGELMGQYSRLD